MRKRCEHHRVTAVARLVTRVDTDDDDGSDPRRMSVSARLDAELADGSSVMLLNDRGWSGSLNRTSEAIPDVWAGTSVEEIEETARVVVGPDEAFDDISQEQMDASHWASLCEALGREGVVADPDELRRLPHDVVLSERLRARVPGHPAAE
jgi:hypothetical protein